MAGVLHIGKRNSVLGTMAVLVKEQLETIMAANQKDVRGYKGGDLAMYDRLKLDANKIEGMIASLRQLEAEADPVGLERYQYQHPNGMKIYNRTAPFGTVLIIYESRPDVTIEAAGIAFKSGNKILLKGGKEALHSNRLLTELWHNALKSHGIGPDWVTYLEYSRQETQAFLENPGLRVDLIVPRGGDKLIDFVKKHASCPVIVSGRGNNFLYVHQDADTEMALSIILNSKTSKISACNALDKVLVDKQLPGKSKFVNALVTRLREVPVEVWVDSEISRITGGCAEIENQTIWYEEFLDYKIVVGEVAGPGEAIDAINRYSGGHSATIVSNSEEAAKRFMAEVDCAAVYHNASTRFTDGGQFGLGGELAISTDKLHQRGPLGLQHLITNKWFIQGTGQIRT